MPEMKTQKLYGAYVFETVSVSACAVLGIAAEREGGVKPEEANALTTMAKFAVDHQEVVLHCRVRPRSRKRKQQKEHHATMTSTLLFQSAAPAHDT